jgi:hypothetical protein
MDDTSEESKAGEPVIDRLTRELRQAFKYVKQEAELRQLEAKKAVKAKRPSEPGPLSMNGRLCGRGGQRQYRHWRA